MIERNPTSINQLDPLESTKQSYDAAENYITDPLEYPNFFLELQKNNPDARILILGCGPADDAASLKDMGFNNIVGTDISTGMIARASRNHPDIRLEVVDMSNAQTYFSEEEKWDVLCLPYSLFHVKKAKLPDTITGFANILKPNGYIYLTTQESLTGIPTEETSQRGDDTYPVYINAEIGETITELFSRVKINPLYIETRTPTPEEHQFFKLTMVLQKNENII